MHFSDCHILEVIYLCRLVMVSRKGGFSVDLHFSTHRRHLTPKTKRPCHLLTTLVKTHLANGPLSKNLVLSQEMVPIGHVHGSWLVA